MAGSRRVDFDIPGTPVIAILSRSNYREKSNEARASCLTGDHGFRPWVCKSTVETVSFPVQSSGVSRESIQRADKPRRVSRRVAFAGASHPRVSFRYLTLNYSPANCRSAPSTGLNSGLAFNHRRATTGFVKIDGCVIRRFPLGLHGIDARLRSIITFQIVTPRFLCGFIRTISRMELDDTDGTDRKILTMFVGWFGCINYILNYNRAYGSKWCRWEI